MPKVSICVPIYNVEKYISRCLDSLINQSLKDIEIIIVNDCTPDASMKIVEEYSEKDSRIIILNHEVNSGLMVARRTGYKAATGDYITFCDSDDWLPISAIENLYSKAEESKADIVCGSIQRVDGNNNFHGLIECVLQDGEDKVSALKAIMNKKVSQNICSKLFKRRLLQDYKYIAIENCTQAEDAGALFQFIDNSTKVVTINDVVYMYYTNAASASYNITFKSIESICKVVKIRESILCKYPDLEDLKNRYFTEILSKYRPNRSTRKLVMKYGLNKYMSFKYIMKYLKRGERNKYIIKYILHFFKIREFLPLR